MSRPVLITCEHAVATVPPEYRPSFENQQELLETHRAYDPGARETARELAVRLGIEAPLEGECTRLLIDLNRSLHHRRVFSEFSPPRGDPRRARLVEGYLTFRARVVGRLMRLLETHSRVVHFSVHSFTPILDGKVRRAQIGLLYDPSRAAEQELCHGIRSQIGRSFEVKMNYPYRGASDGLTTALRQELGPSYLGIELELNHATYFDDPGAWTTLRKTLVNAVCGTIQSYFPMEQC